MLKQWLLLNMCLLHAVQCSQSIKTLLSTNKLDDFVSFDERKEVITVNLANKNLSSLDGFEHIAGRVSRINHRHGTECFIVITLADNNLTSLENPEFLSLVSKSNRLHSLNLSGNKLTKLPEKFLSDKNALYNDSLKNVFLDHNNINRLPKSFLKKTKSLEILNLSNNKVPLDLPEAFFDDKDNLTALINHGRSPTPVRKRSASLPEDLEFALSDSL